MNTLNQVTDTNPFTTGIPNLNKVSDKYRFISTAELINDVQSFGYQLIRTKMPRRGMGMHLMEFTHPDMPRLDGFQLRLLATNSHDGTSAFNLLCGLHVFACTNGVIASDGTRDKI